MNDIQERFLKNIKDHEMTIIKDDGVYRHLRFQRPDSYTYKFDLITWPGHLCITGDMGCWVFSRTEDMFNFFIMDENDFNKDNIINPGYWSEKIQSCSTFGNGNGYYGYKEFDVDLYKEDCIREIQKYWNESSRENVRPLCEKCIEEFNDEVLGRIEYSDIPFEYYRLTHDFGCEGFYFENIPSGEVYTFHYLWICYAIVWGIKKYRG